MTPESIQAMIDQALLRNSTNGDRSHSSHEDNRRNVQTARPCFYADFMKCQPLNFKGTEGVVGLTRWIEKMESVFQISGCAVENQGEIKKLEIELWNVKVKENNVSAYTERFQKLTLICTKFVANETKKIDKYVSRLPDNIYGSVKASKPKMLDETIELANDLMDQKLRTYAERQSNNKRKADESFRNNHGQQQQTPKRQNVTRVYNMGTGEGMPYSGNLPKCTKCHFLRNGPCTQKCHKCNKVGHFARDCRSSGNANVVNALRNNGANPKEKVNVPGWVYAVRNAEKRRNASRDPNLNFVTGTFLLNKSYASILFDTGADRSFKSTAFSSLIDIVPTPLGNSYDVELVDGKIVGKEEDKSEGKQPKDVPVVRDYPEVFPKDLLGLPLARPVEFQIDSIPGAAPIARASYRLEVRLSPAKSARTRRSKNSIQNSVWTLRVSSHALRTDKRYANEKEHKEHLKAILELLKKEKLYAKCLKCEFWIPKKLCIAPILALPEGSKDFVVYCDVSHKGLGVVLMQREKANVVADALSRKERIKPLRIRALVMTIGLDLPKQILEAQIDALKPENLEKEDGYAQGLALERGYTIRMELPQELSRVHHTFHVSNLKKCYADEPLVMPLEGIHVDDRLQFVEEPVEIMEREIKRLKRSRIPLVKVRWNSRRGLEFTWERKDSFRKKYPHLFANRVNKARGAEGVAKALEARDAARSMNFDDSHNLGTCVRRQAPLARECTYPDFMKCKPLYFKGSKRFFELTQWFERMETVVRISNCTTENQIKFTTCTLLELALMCARMFLEESHKIKKYVDGFPDMIYGSVMASKPNTMQDAIEFATELMDKKISTLAERQAKNKRKLDNNNQAQQQPPKKQGVAIAYTTGSGERKEYARTLPLCNK
uniref:CCHC-type domain-containing protein n=1 Tax=Tanacetum cinerariifolium TaxID=118510 RepID=A0A699GNY0_TANCI|nr:hypothetical protein [Tanacetum cinerariifolium]